MTNKNKLTCDNCNSTIEFTKKDIVTEINHVFIFPIKNEFIICNICGNKIFKTPRNYWTINLGFGED
jgi:uncharacterized protein with PIN domain